MVESAEIDFKVKKILVSKLKILLISEKNELYEATLPSLDFIRINEQLGKCMNAFTNGLGCYISNMDCSVPPVKEWSTEKLMNFFSDIKLDDYLNSVKYTKVTGETLLTYDPDDLINNLGIRDAKDQNHLMLYINTAKHGSYEEPKLFAWGINNNMDLGINTGTSNVNVPNKLDI